MDEVRRFGRFELHPAKRQLLIDGEAAAVGARAFDVLWALVERRERTVPKSELLDVVWPDVVVEENNLAVQVVALRKLLGRNAIATIPGRGYRFTLPIATNGANEAPPRAAAATATASNPPHELPPLYGRERDLAEIAALLDAHRLVTLVGAGGIGKTRLAQAVVQAVRERHADGVWLVELAGLADSALLPGAVAQALALSLPGRSDLRDELLAAVAPLRLLLVLDNCEHLLSDVAALTQALLDRAPGVRLLVTSQEPLKLPVEQQRRVQPLALPAADDRLEDARHCGAIALFEARASAVDARFTLTEANLAAVADICRRLDGLPLAIELAAARVGLLGVGGLHERLGERFRLLGGGSRLTPARQQTLHAALDWSHALLQPAEQVVLRRLGMFASGCSLRAAQQVIADDSIDAWQVLDHLGSLVDKSLVVADSGEPPRLRLLETPRAYALEKLAAAGETDTLQRHHAEHYAEHFERGDDAYFTVGRREDDVTDELRPDVDNLRAAVAWASGRADTADLAWRLVVHSARFMTLASLGNAEWSPWAADLQANAIAALPRRLEVRLRHAMWFRGSSPSESNAGLREALALYREDGCDTPRRAYVHAALALNLVMTGDYAAAQAQLDEAGVACPAQQWPLWLRVLHQRFRALAADGDSGPSSATVSMLDGLLRELDAAGDGDGRGALLVRLDLIEHLLLQGEFEAAAGRLDAVAEHALRRRREHNWLVNIHNYRLLALLALGRTKAATDAMRQARQQAQRAGLPYFRPSGAWWLSAVGHHDDAARFLGVCDAERRRTDVALGPLGVFTLKQVLQRLAAVLTPQQIYALRAEGTALDRDAATRLLDCEPQPSPRGGAA